MKNIRFLLLVILTTINLNIYAFENNDSSISSETSSDNAKNEKEEEETIESFIKKNELIEREGFLHLWIDAEKDDYYLLLNSNDLNKEFIYFTYVLDAPKHLEILEDHYQMAPYWNLENLKKILVFLKKIQNLFMTMKIIYRCQNLEIFKKPS